MNELKNLLAGGDPAARILAHGACVASVARLVAVAGAPSARTVLARAVLPVARAAAGAGDIEGPARDLVAPLIDLCSRAVAAGEYDPGAGERPGPAELLRGGLRPRHDLGYFFHTVLPACAAAAVRFGMAGFVLPLYELACALCRTGRGLQALAALVQWRELAAAHGLEVWLRWLELDSRRVAPARRRAALEWWAGRHVPGVTQLLAEQSALETDPGLRRFLVRAVAQRPDGPALLRQRLRRDACPEALAALLRELLEVESPRRLLLDCLANPVLKSRLEGLRAAAGRRPRVWQPHLLFAFETRGKVYATPWEEEGILCVACCDRKVYGLDARTGARLWEFQVPEEVYSSPCGWRGVLYFGCHDGKVYALEIRTARKLWEHATGGVIYSSPAVVDGTLFIGSYDGKVYALDARTGALRWTAATGGGVRSAPWAGNGYVLVGSEDRRVYALQASTGRVLWEAPTQAPVRSSPVMVGDTVYVGSGDGRLYALDAAKGEVRWTFRARGPVDATPCVHRGLVVVGSRDRRLYALEAATGRRRWSFRTGDEICAAPVAHGETLYVAARNGRVYALEAHTGRKLWEFATGGQVYSSPRLAAGVLYVGTHNHRVFALEVEPLPDEAGAGSLLEALVRDLGGGE